MANVYHIKQRNSLDDPGEQQGLIASTWPALAAFAWDCFQKSGRGIVMIDLTDAPSERKFETLSRYVTMGELAEDIDADSDHATWLKILEWLTEYDPAERVIIGLCLSETKTCYHNLAAAVDHMPTPREAYEQKQAAMIDAGAVQPGQVIQFPSGLHPSDDPN